MKEVVFLHIGQAGVQIGEKVWDLLAHEHSVNPSDNNKAANAVCPESTSSAFFETESGRYTPRAVFVDTEDIATGKVQKGDLKDLFSPSSFVTGKESACTFASGFYTNGRYLSDVATETLRKQLENCDQCQTIICTTAVGGGTGGGLGAKMLHRIEVDSLKTDSLISFCVLPSNNMHSTVVENMNAVLSLPLIANGSSFPVFMQNESMYDILSKKTKSTDISYDHVNKLISQVVSAVTNPIRQNSPERQLLFDTVDDMAIASVAPLRPASETGTISCDDLAANSFSASCRLTQSHSKYRKYISSVSLFRGEVQTFEANHTISNMLQNRIINMSDQEHRTPVAIASKFVSSAASSHWKDTLGSRESEVVTIGTHTSLAPVFSKLLRDSHTLFSFRSFMHWYLADGMETAEYAQADEEIRQWVKYLKSCNATTSL